MLSWGCGADVGRVGSKMCTRSLAAGMDTQHQLNQDSSSTELDPNISALWIPYLYAAYIYNGSDDEDASA